MHSVNSVLVSQDSDASVLTAGGAPDDGAASRSISGMPCELSQEQQPREWRAGPPPAAAAAAVHDIITVMREAASSGSTAQQLENFLLPRP